MYHSPATAHVEVGYGFGSGDFQGIGMMGMNGVNVEIHVGRGPLRSV